MTRRARPPEDASVRAFPLRHEGEDLWVLSVPAHVDSLPAALTEAERSVCALVLAGRSNREIAAARGCAPRTVANQIASIFRKTGVGSRAELAALLAGS